MNKSSQTVGIMQATYLNIFEIFFGMTILMPINRSFLNSFGHQQAEFKKGASAKLRKLAHEQTKLH